MRRWGAGGSAAGRATGPTAGTGRHGPRVVVVTSPACAACRRMAPDLDAAAAAHPGVVVERLDAWVDPEGARLLGVRGTPTLVGYRDGIEVVRSTGRSSREALDRMFGELAGDDDVSALGPSATDVKLRSGAGVALVTVGAATGPAWPLVAAGAALVVYGLAGLVRTGQR